MIAAADAGPTTTHALVYNQSSYKTLLDEFPAHAEEMAEYVARRFAAIDQYLAAEPFFKKLIVEPRLASQPALLIQESADFDPLYSAQV